MSINDIKLEFSPFEEHNINYPVRLVIKNEVTKEFTHIKVLKEKEAYKLDKNKLDTHLLYRYKYQVKEKDKWVDHIEYNSIIQERENSKGIKYMYFPNDQSDFLIVIFQGIKDINRKSYYNYIKTLYDVNAPRLYIKDDYGTDKSTQSSYYLGPNKQFIIAEKVIELIEEFREKLGIDKKNIICAGSSKGGFAALYFSFRGKYGYAISGGPQIMLGDYLSKGKLDGHEEKSILPPILRYLCNEITYENIDWANNVLFNEIENSRHNPIIYLHVGENEPHYKNHVRHFLNFTEERSLKNIHIDLANYNTHKELAKHFPNFLIKSIDTIIGDKIPVSPPLKKQPLIQRFLKYFSKKS